MILEPTPWRPFVGNLADAPERVRWQRRDIGGVVSERPEWAWADGRTRVGYWMPESWTRRDAR